MRCGLPRRIVAVGSELLAVRLLAFLLTRDEGNFFGFALFI
jgi:hypothetical protein